MKKILSVVVLLFVFFTPNSHAEKIGSMFEVNNVDGDIQVQSNLMTYYFARFVAPDGRNSSSILISRNDKKVKLEVLPEAKIEWEGYVPTPTFDWPDQWLSFAKEETKITNPANYLSGWENSKIEFLGGNIGNFYDFSQNSWGENKIQSTALVLLNLTVFPQLMADMALDGRFLDGKVSDTAHKALELVEDIKNIERSLAWVNFWLTTLDVSADYYELLSEAWLEEGEPLPPRIYSI